MKMSINISNHLRDIKVRNTIIDNQDIIYEWMEYEIKFKTIPLLNNMFMA